MARSASLMRHGLTEEQVNKVLDYENSDLPERTKMALRLTDKMAFDHHSVDEKFYAGLREHFSDDAIMDLGMMAAFALGWQRFIEAFGIRPDHWKEGDPAPWEAV
jgi:alkylhydroperoxidase family enzyme